MSKSIQMQYTGDRALFIEFKTAVESSFDSNEIGTDAKAYVFDPWPMTVDHVEVVQGATYP